MALAPQVNSAAFVVVLKVYLVILKTDNLTHSFLGVCLTPEIDTIIGLDSMEDWSGMVSSVLRSLTLNQWENR